MKKSYSEVKQESDAYISMTFFLMCNAMNTHNSKAVSGWYRDLLTQSSFAEGISLLSEDDKVKINSACDAVFEKYYSEI